MTESGDVSPSRALRRLSTHVAKASSEVFNKAANTKPQEVKVFFSKPRNMIALGIFGVTLARAFFHWNRDHNLMTELMATFDAGHDHHLTTTEMASLLRANGMEVNVDQVKKLFGNVDDEGDGFDDEELARVVSIVSLLPAASERLQRAASARTSFWFDVAFVALSGLGLGYLVIQSDAIERKWAANSFVHAVKFRSMQVKCNKLDANLIALSQERTTLEQQIAALEASGGAANESQTLELKRLSTRLAEVQMKEENTKKQLEEEVVRLRSDMERSMQEANLARQKMERMMKCIKGLDAFSGIGSGSFAQHGAQQGFSVGFAMDTVTFGTIENGKLLMYETSKRQMLGEGKDCAYRCKDMQTGRDLALKMYTIQNQEQRRAIYHDLYAHRSQVGRHPNIVSYERVIESENMIFVLMELIVGKDLFEVVATHGLSEAEAKPLFLELVQALQHLHQHEVIHCDVKPENAMVQGEVSSGKAHLKLIDFGCSCFNKLDSDTQGCVVYDTYTPPELAAKTGAKPTVATDMWRLGCTLYIMLVRRPPFYPDVTTGAGRAQREASNFFKPAEYDGLSAQAKDLIANLIVGDPAKRLSTEQVLAHPWVA